MFEQDDLVPRPQGEAAARKTSDVSEETEPPPAPDAPEERRRRRAPWRAIAIAIVLALAVYYPAGMLLSHRIDDDLSYTPPADMVPKGGSLAVAVAAGLVAQEVNDAGWVANDPFFFPAAALDNMPNYQVGMIQALFRFAIELTDQMGRTRGSSQADPDLDAAAGELKFPPDVWVWDPKISFLPTAASEDHYRRAVTLLIRYNRRLGEGNATFDRRADNLLGTLDRFAADLGSASAEIDHHVLQESSGLIDFTSDDLFYNVKGRLYAYTMILGALATDFARTIQERQLDAAWQHMLDSFRQAVALDPLVVANGTPDGVVPSHLVAQGFYLLRARTQLREITNILLK